VPVNVVFDTDMMSDIDDALALAMLHSLHDRHEANLVAVTVSTDDKWCASYVDLIDTFYGHPNIPVGIVHGGVNLRNIEPNDIPKEENYTQVLSERRRPDGTLVYPHRLVDGSKAPEAVELLRRVLVAQVDKSVVMIQVGFSTNLARLLDSKPDGASSLNGRDLVQEKVRLLSVMAGNYGESIRDGKVLPRGASEFNLELDVPAAQRLFAAWPTPIVASGFEIGLSMKFPASAIERYFSYTRDHPIAETYRDYVDWWGMKWPHDHPTFDLTAVLYAVRPDADYFALSKPGKITVLLGGLSRFDETESGTHRHLILPEEKRARALEAMVMLASQPPAVRGP
jgi:inosine-uridine nucleoside N-ribohydrolase